MEPIRYYGYQNNRMDIPRAAQQGSPETEGFN